MKAFIIAVALLVVGCGSLKKHSIANSYSKEAQDSTFETVKKESNETEGTVSETKSEETVTENETGKQVTVTESEIVTETAPDGTVKKTEKVKKTETTDLGRQSSANKSTTKNEVSGYDKGVKEETVSKKSNQERVEEEHQQKDKEQSGRNMKWWGVIVATLSVVAIVYRKQLKCFLTIIFNIISKTAKRAT